jgi:hypothetical protein
MASSSSLFFTLSDTAESAYDLIDFLAVAQAMGIAILPITWQSAQEIANAKGGTSQIHDATIDLENSLVFKRVSDENKQKISLGRLTKSSMFDAFINEMVILGESTVREEPTVVKLQGITWDILRDDELWPALVFEKADHGDLEDFLGGEEGRELHALARVRFCQQIAYSVSRLHQSGM